MTLEEFLVWDAPRTDRWQLVDGEPVAVAPTVPRHRPMHNEIGRLIGNHVVERQSPCSVVTAPGVVPQVRSDMNFRIPHFGVICSPPGPTGMTVMDPVLLIEILSPSNQKRTRVNIWAYATIPSVQEILLLRVARIEAELLRRDADGNWPAGPIMIGPNDILTLESIAFTAPLATLYRTTGLQAAG